MAVPSSRYAKSPQKLINPPRTQNKRVAPTLSVACMMVDGVENIPVPTIRLTMSKEVEKKPSFRSLLGIEISYKTSRIDENIQLEKNLRE